MEAVLNLTNFSFSFPSSIRITSTLFLCMQSCAKQVLQLDVSPNVLYPINLEEST